MALTCVEIKKLESLSKSQKKKLCGLLDSHNPLAGYLIGQLGRNSEINNLSLPGVDILEQAIGIIKIAQKRVAGRFALIECTPKPGLLEFYENNGFHILSQDDYLYQMYRIID